MLHKHVMKHKADWNLGSSIFW